LVTFNQWNERLLRRKRRLDGMTNSVKKATAAYARAIGAGKTSDLHLRTGFAFQTEPAPSGSDRRAPAREFRPPATRIARSRGVALSFELTAVSIAQSRKRPGTKVVPNPLRMWPAHSDEMPFGWIDLVASDVKASGQGRNHLTENDKKLRQVQNALQVLEDAELVRLPGRSATKGAYEGFLLLDERGGRGVGEPLDYRVPRASESCFRLPSSFFSNAWVHVLEDSEISLLLMVACRVGTLQLEDGAVAIPAAVRSLHYGIGRDSFGSACHMLEAAGLFHVEEVDRYADGRAKAYHQEGASLHRLRLLPEGFDRDAVEALRGTIDNELN
jgi:hypothetical protein